MIIDSRRRSAAPALVAAALLLAVGGAGFWLMKSRSGVPDGATQAAAEPASASDVARHPDVTASAPMAAASPAAVVTPAASAAARTVPSWQASLQPAVVAVTRGDALVAYQAQVEHWKCEGEQCAADFRIPPTVPGGQSLSSASDLFNGLQKQMALAGVDVGLSSIKREPQGIAVSLQFTPSASAPGRFYTYAEIASIRLEMLEQGQKTHCEKPAP